MFGACLTPLVDLIFILVPDGGNLTDPIDGGNLTDPIVSDPVLDE